MSLNLLEQLNQEHHCLLTLATQIDLTLTEISQSPAPDYPALLEQVQTLRHRFSEQHQSKEQLLVDQLLADSGTAQSLLDTFINSHGLLFTKSLDRLERQLSAITHDQLVSRSTIQRLADDALLHLTAQIQAEEQATLPWAQTQLDDEAWAQIARGLENDPNHCAAASNSKSHH